MVSAKVVGNTMNIFEKLASAVQWQEFRISGTFFNQIKAWKDRGNLTMNVQESVLTVLKKTSWGVPNDSNVPYTETCVVDMLIVILFLIQNLNLLEATMELTCEAFNTIIKNIVSNNCLDQISANSFRVIISSMPRKWFGRVDHIEYHDSSKNGYPLTMCCALLKYLAVNHNISIPENTVDDRQIMYISYLVDLLSAQTNTENARDLLVVQSKSFNDASIGIVINELLASCENMRASSLEFACRKIMFLLNTCSREEKIHSKLWSGIILSIKLSGYPLIYLKQSFNSIASAEEMALVTEECIDRYLILTRDCYSWRVIQQIIQIPELDESTFIRHCLSHCLTFTLHAYLIQRLSSARGSRELEISIGEQLGVWIESLKVESIKDGKEGKIILMISQFAHLLQKELHDMTISEHHSRLRAHLPPIADALFRWSDDKKSRGIWASLGFGTTSLLSCEFVLFCRVLAAFIVTRLLGSDSNDEREKIIEGVAQFSLQSVYTKYSSHIDKVFGILRDPNETLVSMSKIVEMHAQLFFADQLILLYDQK